MVTPVAVPLCTHIRVNGTRCRAIALRDHRFCHFHRDLSQRRRAISPDLTEKLAAVPETLRSAALLKRESLTAEYFGLKAIGPEELDLPDLEDPDAIQVALSSVVHALGRNQINLKRANALLYALQIATVNVSRVTQNNPDAIHEVAYDDEGNLLAPPEMAPLEIAPPENLPLPGS